MLTSLRGLLVAALLSILTVSVLQAPANAKDCPNGETTTWKCVENDEGGEDCGWVTTCKSGSQGETGNNGQEAGSGGSGGSQTCSYQGEDLPSCTGPNGSVWNGTCFLGGPLPDFDEPGPNGETSDDGAWHYCYLPPGAPPISTTSDCLGHGSCIWVPAGSEPAVNPVDVAWMAIAQMTLSPIDVGIVPKTGEDKLGLVGLPTWMWVDGPSGSTWGPITRSASEGPVSVSATAEATQVTWDMGDGKVVVCGKGVPYQPSFGVKESPNCGHRYEHTSAEEPGQAYQVVATTHWVVNWSSGTMSGTIEFDLESDPVAIRVGEMQVLVQ